MNYNIIAITETNTVVAEYTLVYDTRGDSYQSEAELEQEFIRILAGKGMSISKSKMKPR